MYTVIYSYLYVIILDLRYVYSYLFLPLCYKEEAG